jgi:hypothetical protein
MIPEHTDRERAIMMRIAKAGILAPTAVTLGRGGGSVAVAFNVGDVTETVEGCGTSDEDLADDVVRQLRDRFRA